MSISACTKINTGTEQPDEQYPYIFFDAEIAQTKSNLLESLPSSAGTGFGVFGYRGGEAIFDGGVAHMYRKEAGSSFLYDNLVLWTDANHDFYAYYPYNENTTVGKAETGPYVSYTQPTSLADMVDFMTASKTGCSYSSSSVVPFVFNHRLFAFDVEIKNSQSYATEDLTISSATVTLHSVSSGARLYYDGTIADIGNTSDITETFGSSTIEKGETLTLNGEDSFLLLPTGSLTISFNIKGTDEFGDFDISVDLQTIPSTFEAGQRYKMVISKVDGEGFTATVSGWTDGDNITFTFN